jgi:hypothetical protein
MLLSLCKFVEVFVVYHSAISKVLSIKIDISNYKCNLVFITIRYIVKSKTRLSKPNKASDSIQRLLDY